MAGGVHEKLPFLAGKFAKWEKDTFGSVRGEIKHLKPGRVGLSHKELKINELLVELYF